jgi:hypothetical protein
MQDFSPVSPYIPLFGSDWIQAGARNGVFHGFSNTYRWAVEHNSWCNGFVVNTFVLYNGQPQMVKVENVNSGTQYSCGTGGAHYFHRSTGEIAYSVIGTSWWTRGISAFRVDANSEYEPGTHFNPMGGSACYGGTRSGSSCSFGSGQQLQRRDSGGLADWSNTLTASSDSGGYYHISSSGTFGNSKMRVTSIYE